MTKVLEPMGNVAKAKEKGFDWFCMVQEGYAEKFNLKKPSQSQLEKLWFETTGQKVEKSKNKLKINDNG